MAPALFSSFVDRALRSDIMRPSHENGPLAQLAPGSEANVSNVRSATLARANDVKPLVLVNSGLLAQLAQGSEANVSNVRSATLVRANDVKPLVLVDSGLLAQLDRAQASEA